MISNIKNGIENTAETINLKTEEPAPVESNAEGGNDLIKPEPSQPSSSAEEPQNPPNLPAEETGEPQPSSQ